MPTNLAIDDELIKAAQKLGKHKTKKAAVTEALQEYIQRRKQIEITELFQEIDADPETEYKKQRSMK
jgi:Arc/MetJ family transcription regulator